MKTFLLVSLLFGSYLLNNTNVTISQKKNSFKSGEKLLYRLHYGMVDGGYAFLNLEEKNLDGKKVFHAQAIAKTVGMADALYRVQDVYECYMDMETCMPIKSIRNVSEAKYKLYNEVFYKHDEKKAISQKTGEHKVPENIQDIVSTFYYARQELFSNLKPGQVITMNTFFDDKIYPLQIRYRKTETIKTKFGKIECMKFSPVVEPGRVFDTPDDLDIWISNDKNLIPVRIQLNLIVGSVKCDLEGYEGLQAKLDFN